MTDGQLCNLLNLFRGTLNNVRKSHYKMSRRAHLHTDCWRAGLMGFDSRQGQCFFSSSLLCPYRLWGLTSPLFNGYRRLFFRKKNGRSVNLTTHLHLVPRFKTHGAGIGLRGTIIHIP